MNVKFYTGFLVSLIFVGVSFSAAGKTKTFEPSDLNVPVFDSIGFIIDPENRIDEEWFFEMVRTRETYFFPRYIEPVCVRVDNIKNPDDPKLFAEKLVSLWDLEKKTNGRFVFQLHCKSKKQVVFIVGSRLKVFYSKYFLEDLATETADVHLTGKANGTGDFVSLQKMGDHIFREIRFDSKLLNYSNNTGIHHHYPNRVQRSNGELKTMSESHYADGDIIFTGKEQYTGVSTEPSEIDDIEIPKQSSQADYFKGISLSEIDENYSAINTSGIITDYKNVPNAREINNGHVTDPHNLLNDFAIGMINELLDTLEQRTGYQVAVVCLNSIGDNDPRIWGTDLFNHWGIGSKETENGLLMLLINDIHGIDFITGRGTETVLTDVDCYNIQQEEMVPHFKNNDYVTGMIRGTQAVCDFLYGTPPLYSSSTTSDDYGYDELGFYQPVPWYESGFFKFYFSVIIFLSASWFILLAISFFIRDLHKRYHVLKFFTLLIWPILFPVPFAIIYFINIGLMKRWRNTTRFSTRTGEEMHKLDDHGEDKHLDKGQLTEEKVKSIDYDVWVTFSGSEILILKYKKWFSKYNKCPKCSYKTYFKLYDKTITAATYDSSGTGERCYKCENCGHSKTERYTIPRKTRSSSSGSSGGGGGYSSSYSSGGSSYGGGSSRGGGSGSRW